MSATPRIFQKTFHHCKLSSSQPRSITRSFSITMTREDPFKPAKRVAGQKQDVWFVILQNGPIHSADHIFRSIVNEAAAASPVQPIVNMGQGFFGYNPPAFVIDAAKQALDKVDCNQYSPTKVGLIDLGTAGAAHIFAGKTTTKESSG